MVAKYPHRKPYKGRYPRASLTGASWLDEGACTPGVAGARYDPRLHLDPVRVDDAIAVCRTCAVIAQCFDFAVRLGAEDGVWGGQIFDDKPTSRRRGA